MKSKEAFLDALQQGIAVLAESEQQDILEEYAQHIEMKLAGGQTEEEAIQDFGDIHELIAEILEAYHVNPAYANQGEKPTNINASIGRWFSCLGQRLHSATHNTTQVDSEQAAMEATLTQEQPGTGASHSLKKIRGRLGRVLKVAAWFGWNGALLLCALPVIGLGITALLLLGLIAVWLAQGMPLVGSFLCCVGLLAASVGVLGLGKSLIWHRHSRDSQNAARQKEGMGNEEE